VLPFVVIATGVIAVSSRLPSWYRAETLILATARNISPEYVRTAVAMESVRDRLPSISQQITSRTRLERIIEELDLYAEDRRASPMELVIEQMRNDISVDVAGVSETFRVSYQSRSPFLAMKVTERIAELFIEESLQDRRALAAQTSRFLETQLEDARRRLVAQEKRLEVYRLQHGSELPTQLASNIQVIQNTQTQIQSLSEAINRDRDRRLLAARQLADLRAQELTTDPTLNVGGAPMPASSTLAQLDAARVQLAALELRLTPEHPDLIRARQSVAELEARALNEADDSVEPDSSRTRPLSASEIAKRNRIKELQAEIESLDRQVADKIVQQTDLRSTLEAYQARVDAVPTRESDLISITRDYDTLQTLYRTLLQKKEESKIAENLERRQVGEQFKILDPPRVPERPFRPNRILLNLAGALGGLTFGIGLAALFEFRDKTVRGETDVHLVLALPVVALIPAMVNRADVRRRRLRQAWQVLAVGAVLAACATVVWSTFRV
jgi:polysaccharide chain length determinant protein (PEP-CTERM system associated)